MPNIKSAIKRVKVSQSKALKNTIRKSALKTAVKKCKEAINNNDTAAAKVLVATSSSIDKAASRKLIHKNTAARKKSRLAKALNAVSANR